MARLKLKEFLKDVEALFFDCDGVLWEGMSLFPNIKELISFLIGSGIKVFYVSNNSTKSVREYAMTFQKFGISTQPHQIMISTIATLIYIKSLDKVKNIYIIG